MSTTIHLALIFVISVCVSNAYAMRCNNQLISEGDSAHKVVTLCGNPTFQDYSYIVYENKDGDGMDYRLHIGGAGTVDSITFSRGVL